jgi:RNA polymerase sigma-70 factor (ECF subfamily)
MISPNFDFTSASEASDESLMQAITERHQPALNELYSRYGRTLKAAISSVVREEGEADDVLQETMLQIWREGAKYSPSAGKPLGWISTITRRRAIDRWRRSQTYRRAKERYAESHLGVPDCPLQAGTDEITRSDLRSFLNRQLRKLPIEQSEAVKLAFFKGMSHREIAAATAVPLGTVKTRLELGLRKLTQAISSLRHEI